MSQYKTHYLSDEEFLRSIIIQRNQSPLIEELARRLEESIHEPAPTFTEILDCAAMLTESLDEKNIIMTCPTCETHLVIDIDSESETVSLNNKSAI